MQTEWKMIKHLYNIFRIWRKYPYLKLAALLDMCNHQSYLVDRDYVDMIARSEQILAVRNMYEKGEYERREIVGRTKKGIGEQKNSL